MPDFNILCFSPRNPGYHCDPPLFALPLTARATCFILHPITHREDNIPHRISHPQAFTQAGPAYALPMAYALRQISNK